MPILASSVPILAVLNRRLALLLLAGGLLGWAGLGAGPAGASEQAAGDSACPPGFPFALTLPEEWNADRERFRQAHCHAMAGRYPEALAGFQALMLDRPELSGFWRWHLIRTLALSGDHAAAVARFEDLFQADPDEELVARLRDLVLDQALHSESNSPEVRILYLDGFLKLVRPDAEDYPLKMARRDLALARGEAEVRRELDLWMWSYPKDKAVAQEVGYPAALDGTPALPQPPEILMRARRLFSLRLFETLVQELETLPLEQAPPEIGKDLGRLYFRALIRGRQLDKAAVQVHTPSVIRRFAFDDRQQLIWAIRIQLRRRKIGSVLKFVQNLEERHPGDGELPSIYLELMRYNRGRGNHVTMNHWFERLFETNPDSETASEALWFLVWDLIRRKEYAGAVQRIDQALPHTASYHPVDQARLLYWKGRLATLLGDAALGKKVWDEMIERWPYGYYASLVFMERSGVPATVRSLPNIEAGRAEGEPPPLTHLWQQSPFPEALFLFSIGEAPLAAEMLEAALPNKLSDEVVEEAAGLFQFLGRHHLLLRLMANHRLDRLRSLPVTDTPLWHRAYPLSHWPLVETASREQQIDPLLIMAIMREESRFSTRADSSAGAKGLMQLMPSTARMIAKRSGLPYEENMLHLPELNIPLGAIYLKRILSRFGGNIVFTSAAYNAGPTTVGRWVRRFGSVPLDEFVERIPYGETQRYVKRVFLSYFVYHTLYGEAAGASLTATEQSGNGMN